jgi:hypothetical protein
LFLAAEVQVNVAVEVIVGIRFAGYFLLGTFMPPKPFNKSIPTIDGTSGMAKLFADPRPLQ